MTKSVHDRIATIAAISTVPAAAGAT